MVNKSKILSDLSKMAVDAMGTFSSVRKEIEVIVGIQVNKIINNLNLVKRDEFEVLKKLVQNLSIKNQNLKKKSNKVKKSTKSTKKRTKSNNKILPVKKKTKK